MMLDTDMIASPNFARRVYDGDGSTFGSEVSGPAGSGTVERVLTDYWAKRGMVSEPIPFDGRTYSTVTGQPPASTMNTFATNPTLAQQQADSLNGNALRSLEQFKGTLVHAVWY